MKPKKLSEMCEPGHKENTLFNEPISLEKLRIW